MWRWNSHSQNWDLGVLRDSQNFRVWLHGSKHLALGCYLYHWKTIEVKMSKMASLDHLDIWNTSYGQKKGRESNWQFSQPLNVENRPDPGVCRWSATHRWKALKESYNFALDFIPIGSLSKELWLFKILRVQTEIVSGLLLRSLLGVLGQKAIRMWVSRRGAEYTIWGKVVASPESGPWWVKWVQSCLWLVLAPKVLQNVN